MARGNVYVPPEPDWDELLGAGNERTDGFAVARLLLQSPRVADRLQVLRRIGVDAPISDGEVELLALATRDEVEQVRGLAMELLCRLLCSPASREGRRSAIRRLVVRALGEVGSAESTERVALGLADADEGVRQAAFEVLAVWLLPDEALRRATLAALEQPHEEPAIAPLLLNVPQVSRFLLRCASSGVTSLRYRCFVLVRRLLPYYGIELLAEARAALGGPALRLQPAEQALHASLRRDIELHLRRIASLPRPSLAPEPELHRLPLPGPPAQE